MHTMREITTRDHQELQEILEDILQCGLHPQPQILIVVNVKYFFVIIKSGHVEGILMLLDIDIPVEIFGVDFDLFLVLLIV